MCSLVTGVQTCALPISPSRPTVASANPSIIAARVLKGEPRPMPMKLQKVRNWTAKSSGGPKRSANFATSGARTGMTITAKKAPTKEEVNAQIGRASRRERGCQYDKTSVAAVSLKKEKKKLKK